MIDPKRYPKKHPEGSLKRGDSVFYRGERYWVENAHDHWGAGVFIRISSVPVHPDPERLPSVQRESFCCHADMLTLAPTTKNRFGPQPTMAAIERKERAKVTGITDRDDPAAQLLRGKDLDAAYAIVAKCLKANKQDLISKYFHLNPGQQRMNLGNRLRAAHKKGLVKL